MGTNYYFYDKTDTRKENGLHIGKSSGGWCFSLNVHPKLGINDLQDWVDKIAKSDDCVIEDEYENEISLAELLQVITERSFVGKHYDPNSVFSTKFYTSEEDFLKKNHAATGPNGLLRHAIQEDWCIKHGEGTWDCLVGDFC